jgi:hypothetical protein
VVPRFQLAQFEPLRILLIAKYNPRRDSFRDGGFSCAVPASYWLAAIEKVCKHVSQY